MNLVNLFMVSELVVLWIITTIAVWEFKWAYADRKKEKE